MRVTGSLCCAAVVLACAAMLACQPKTTNPSSGGVSSGDGAGQSEPSANVWRIRPIAVRVYPSTRFVEEDGATTLMARIELLDEMGDTTKGVGDMRIELYAAGGPNVASVGQHLYTWRIELNTIEQQRRHYDAITRTYLFRLRLQDEVSARLGTVLVVTFTEPQGGRLTDRVHISAAGRVTPRDVLEQ